MERGDRAVVQSYRKIKKEFLPRAKTLFFLLSGKYKTSDYVYMDLRSCYFTIFQKFP